MARRPLVATYRLQLHKDFRFADARALVPYLASLGISHVYCSPILRARAGSTHGYDVADPTMLNPELGTDADWRALVDAAHEHGMGIVLDIVPNHMGVGPDNPFWEDLLANGQGSRYARWFDVDWYAPDPELEGRIFLPVLGDELDAILERCEITVERTPAGPRLRYFDHSFPLAPGTADTLPEGEIDAERMHALLDRQRYLLGFWRRAPREINYRRFFDVNELVALRTEDADVFDATHALVLAMVERGDIDALRIDHVDGLRDPRGYLERLRAEVSRRRPPDEGRDFPIVVEKILSPGEHLREEWPVQGTTGYEFISDIEGIFLDPTGTKAIESAYRNYLGIRRASNDFAEVALRGKLQVLRGALQADVRRLAKLLAAAVREVLPNDRAPAAELSASVVALIAGLPVYRTYLDDRPHIHPEDRKVIDVALARGREREAVPASALDRLARLLFGTERGDARQRFVERWQQTSGPATAKGVEDTAIYRYFPLASRNEVGGEPDRPLDDAVERLHRANAERAADWPGNLLCVTTHDTKRTADVRARLDGLSEVPDEWRAVVRRWQRRHKALKGSAKNRPAPDANAEYLLYQTVLGVWPVEAVGDSSHADDDARSIHERVDAYMLKAQREGKERTTWTDPDAEYEAALKRFIASLLAEPEGHEFRLEMAALVRRLARPGFWTGLARHLVQLSAPGVPDIYQGDEMWNLALVDPDNRRPVDYDRRRRLVAADPPTPSALVRQAEDGAIKLALTRRALAARRAGGALFERGAYEPLAATGGKAAHVFAYARRDGARAAIVVVPRLVQTLMAGADGAPLGEAAWGDTRLTLPAELAGRGWRCALSDRTVSPGESLSVAEILDALPVALLIAQP